MKHTLADTFQIQDYADNWEALDASPGAFITTSGDHPSWGIGHTGMLMVETDTGLLWRWTGSAFVRVASKGLVSDPDDARTTLISSSSTTYVNGVVTAVAVAPGDRPHLIVVEGPSVKNTNGITELAIARDSTVLQEWRQYGGTGVTAAEQPRPCWGIALDVPTPATYNYRLMFRASLDFGGTSTLGASAEAPLAIHVIEV